jgi:hypothetical protein
MTQTSVRYSMRQSSRMNGSRIQRKAIAFGVDCEQRLGDIRRDSADVGLPWLSKSAVVMNHSAVNGCSI